MTKDELFAYNIFIDNEYFNLYYNFCYNMNYEHVKFDKHNRFGLDGIELHHIIPKSYNGTNEAKNIIKLNHNEHIYAHYLLIKCLNPLNEHYYGIQYGFILMSKNLDENFFELVNDDITILNNLNIERQNAINSFSKKMKGRHLTEEHINKIKLGLHKWHENEDPLKKELRLKRISEKKKGHIVTEETREKISKTKQNKPGKYYKHTEEGLNTLRKKLKKYYENPEIRKIISDRQKEKFKNPENRNYMRKLKLGSHWYNNGIISKQFFDTDIIPDGWIKGRLMPWKNKKE